MRVLIVNEKEGSAIDRMNQGIKKYLPHIKIDIISVHPKRPTPEQLSRFVELAPKADVLNFEYWKTYVMLRDEFPELMNKPKILAHHNPYNLFEENWNEFDKVIAYNADMARRLKDSIHFQHTIDLERFPFNREYTDSKTVLMVSSRIESKKGVLPVAQVCKKLGYKLLLVGSISKRDYFDEVMATGCVEFKEKVSHEELLKAYYESAICVCNSVDNFESGTLINLEAMATGVPLLTRNIGEIPELNNEKNMVVRKGQPEDLKDLERELKDLMDNPTKRQQIRDIAWGTVKVRDDVRRAREYEKLWYSLLSEKPLVSVIVPTFNRRSNLIQIIESVISQDYPNIELVICDDGSSDGTGEMVSLIREKTAYPIKYTNTGTPAIYNLGQARNQGVIEAIGEILVFNDDRYVMKKDAVSRFVEKLHPKKWLFGSKGTGKRSFVENFSCVYRKEFINAGMFNTSVKLYGFLTQETRVRFMRQGFEFKFIERAEVESVSTSKAKYKKKDEIRRAKNILSKMGF